MWKAWLSQISVSELNSIIETVLEQFVADGRSIWFGTLHFNVIRGIPGDWKIIGMMQAEVERLVYTFMLKKIYKDPQKLKDENLPALIGFPDTQVAQRTPTARSAEILPNGGLHYHFLLAVSPAIRLAVSPDQYVNRGMSKYPGMQRYVCYCNLRPLSMRGKPVADYLFKHMNYRNYTTREILILPRAEQKSHTTPAISPFPTRRELRSNILRLFN
jgi:hypothetical protein